MALITDDVRAAIKAFCAPLPPLVQPDGMYGRSIAYLQDCANRALSQADSPLKSEWFEQLVTRGTAVDLYALCEAFDEANTDAATNVKYRLLQRLFTIAYERDQDGLEVSSSIPVWYEGSGWWRAVPWHAVLWNCEKRLVVAPEATS
jgi:hypothetical protein